jgi:hypothetical protein
MHLKGEKVIGNAMIKRGGCGMLLAWLDWKETDIYVKVDRHGLKFQGPKSLDFRAYPFQWPS